MTPARPALGPQCFFLQSDDLAVLCVEPGSIIKATEITGPERRFWHMGLSAAWLVLLIGESLALSLSFDMSIPAVAGQPSAFARLLVHSSALLRLAICVATTTTMVLLGSSKLRHELSDLVEQSGDRGLAGWWIALHLTAYAAFFWSTKLLIDGMARSTHQGLPVSLWLSCGAATCVSWALALRPPGFWFGLSRHLWKAMLFGTAVGILALEIGGTTGRLWESFQNWTFLSAGTVLSLFNPAVICDPVGSRARDQRLLG